jgi:acetoin utilization protein AcuB
MRVGEIMTKQVRTVSPVDSADAAYFQMRRDGVHHLVVLGLGGKVAGVISNGDLGGPEGEVVRRGKRVGDLMTPAPVVVSPGIRVREAANILRGWNIGCVPVVEKGRVAGILTTADVCALVGRGAIRTQRISAVRAGRRYQERGVRQRAPGKH